MQSPGGGGSGGGGSGRGGVGDLYIDVAAVDFDFESGHASGGVVIVLAGGAIEFPKVVGADHAAIVDLALAERTALMEAHAAEGVDGPAGTAYGVGSIAHHHLHDGIRGQLP